MQIAAWPLSVAMAFVARPRSVSSYYARQDASSATPPTGGGLDCTGGPEVAPIVLFISALDAAETGGYTISDT